MGRIEGLKVEVGGLIQRVDGCMVMTAEMEDGVKSLFL